MSKNESSTEENRKVQNFVGRRSALKGLGASLVAGNTIGVVSGATNYVRIVTARNKENPVETAKVPRSWYEYEQRVDRVLETLEQRYQKDANIADVRIVGSEKQIQGKTVTQLEVAVTEDADLTKIPEEVNGVSIRTTTINPAEPLSDGSCHNGGQYDPVPGGVKIGEGSSDGGIGTCSGLVEYQGVKYMMHAYHVFGGETLSGCEDVTYQTAYQSGQDVGWIQYQNPNDDYVLIDHGDESYVPDWSPGVRLSSDGTIHSVSAWFTHTGLKNAKEENRPIYHQGVTSGLVSGEISNLNVSWSHGCSNYNDGVEFTADAAGGDSGGPAFAFGKNNPDNLVIVGHVTAGRNSKTTTVQNCFGEMTAYNDTLALGAYSLANEENVYYVTS